MRDSHLKPLVFGLGLVKTGTTSLAAAMDILGWRPCSDVEAMKRSWNQYQIGGQAKPFEDLAGTYRAFFQNPVSLRYRQLLDHYPEALFVLTTRDVDEVIASMMIHVAWTRLHPRRESLAGDWLNLNSEEDEKLLKEHEEAVLEHFRDHRSRHRVLRMDITKGDGWDKLCPFLSVDQPAMPFPHHNHSKGRLRDMLTGEFRYKGRED